MTTASTLLNFTLHHVVPVLPASGWALLGEAATKWVPVAAQRFQGLQDSADGFRVSVTGVAGEDVQVSCWCELRVYVPWSARIARECVRCSLSFLFCVVLLS